MSKSKRVQARTLNDQPTIVLWLNMAIVIGFLFIAPFYKGLFNGSSHVFDGSILLFSLSIQLITTWKIQDNRNEMALFVWLIPLSYFISSFFAASTHTATNAIFINLLYATLFVAGIYLTKQRIGLSLLKWGVLLSSYVIVMFGISVNNRWTKLEIMTDSGRITLGKYTCPTKPASVD